MIKLIVAGRIGQDAEIKSVGDTTVCSFSVAHTEKTFGNNPTAAENNPKMTDETTVKDESIPF